MDKAHKLNLSRTQQLHIHTYTLIPQNGKIVSLQYSFAYDITASSPKHLLCETLASGHQTGNPSTTWPLQFVVAVATAVRVVGDGYNHYHDDCYASQGHHHVSLSRVQMMRLLFVAVVVVVAQASTIPPSLPDSTTAAPPDVTDVDVTTTAAIDVTDTGAPVTDTVAPVTDTAAPGTDVTTDNPSTGIDASTAVPSNVTMIPADCNPSRVQIQSVIDFSNTPEFQKLSENQQIVVYELLAAAEACRIKEFITPETAQRIFLLVEGGYTAVYGSASEGGYTAVCGSASEGGYTAVYGSAAEGGYTAVYGSAAEGGYTAVYGSAAEGGYTAVYGSAAEATESRRDQEREVSWTLKKKLAQKRSRAGRWCWASDLDIFCFSCFPAAELRTLSL